MVRTDSTRTWKAIERELEDSDWRANDVFPKKFLLALRAALESGLTCEEITAALLLMTGLEELRGRMDGDELLRRVRAITTTMSGDL